MFITGIYNNHINQWGLRVKLLIIIWRQIVLFYDKIHYWRYASGNIYLFFLYFVCIDVGSETNTRKGICLNICICHCSCICIFNRIFSIFVSLYFVCIEAGLVANTGKGICLYKSQLASGHKSPPFIFRMDPYRENHSEIMYGFEARRLQPRLADWLIIIGRKRPAGKPAPNFVAQNSQKAFVWGWWRKHNKNFWGLLNLNFRFSAARTW